MDYYEEVKNKLKVGVVYQLKEMIDFMDVRCTSVKFSNVDLTTWRDQDNEIWIADNSDLDKLSWMRLWENVIVEEEKSEESYYDKVKRMVKPGVLYKLKSSIEFYGVNLNTIAFQEQDLFMFSENINVYNLNAMSYPDADWEVLYDALLEIRETEPVKEPEIKVGDWVMGWHTDCGDWRNKPWQVGEIYMYGDNKTVTPKYHGDGRQYGTHFINIVKLSKDEVLEWVNGEYPIHSKYTDPGGCDVCYASKKAEYVAYDAIDVGISYVYFEGKWAEKLTPEPSFDGPDMPYTTADISMVIDYRNKTVRRYPITEEQAYSKKPDHNPFLLKTKSSRKLNANIVSTKAVDIKIK